MPVCGNNTTQADTGGAARLSRKNAGGLPRAAPEEYPRK